MKINTSKLNNFISDEKLKGLETELQGYNMLLHNGKGAGSDFLGWVNLPSTTSSELLADIEKTAKHIQSKAEIVIVIGIGGSYLGSKAVLDCCTGNFDYLKKQACPHIVFAGQTLSEDYTYELLEAIKDKSIALLVISKSGTTTEPAIAFRILKAEIEKRYGKQEAASRIVAVTDESRGALKTLADIEGYKCFSIADDIGGRFSVLSPVGLLPLAIAGLDIRSLMKGAADMEEECGENRPMDINPAMQYAASRVALHRAGKKIEILACYEPKLTNIGEWWKQLYGESEGKQGKGLFPASVTFTSDLHSMGQYIQDGERSLFETVISVQKSKYEVTIEANADDLDGLNFLAGKRLTQINRFAQLGTMLSHVDGQVPNIEIELEQIDEYNIGALLYFFEKACGISGYALDINPFDQPGVEGYKKNMFALLGKPGFEKETEEILKRI